MKSKDFIKVVKDQWESAKRAGLTIVLDRSFEQEVEYQLRNAKNNGIKIEYEE